MSVVILSQATTTPSDSVWKGCPNTLLNDLGLGAYINQNFLGDFANAASTAIPPGIESFTGAGTTVTGLAASATFGPHVLSLATGATDNNNAALFGEELGAIPIGSQNTYRFETRIALTTLGDAAFFVGLTTRAGANTATTGLIAADPSNSAAAATVGVSNIGFISVQASSAIATVNAVYKKTSGSAVTVATNVTNSTAIPVASRANMVAATFKKFGVFVDCQAKLVRFFVDGYLVASQALDSTFDTAAGTYYVPVVAFKTGAAAAVTGNVDFVRAALQSRY